MADIYSKKDKGLKTNKYTGTVDGSGDGKQKVGAGMMHKMQASDKNDFNQAWKTGKPKDCVYKGGNGMGK